MAGNVIVLEKELLKSEAFRSLPGTAIVILIDFMMKRRITQIRNTKREKITIILNNGEIEYCYSEAEKKGITRQTFVRNLDILIERGFIDLNHQGVGGRKGDKSLYGISDRWKKWGTIHFIRAKREKDKRKGVGFSKYWSDKNK